MTTTLPTVLISGASEELTARIEHLVRGQAELSLVKTVMPEDAVNATFKAKLIWIELESDPEGNVALLEHLIESHPNTFFVVSKEDLEPDLVKRTMQIGALDFLDHKGWAAQIRSVVRRIMAKEFGSKPSPGSPMAGAAARQPQRPSSWGSLNSLKVTVPPNSGFKRVEPSKAPPPAQPLEPRPQAAPPAAPSRPAPPPPPEPEEIEVQEELPSAEESDQGGYEESAAEGEVGYAEGETESNEINEGFTEDEGGYAESEGETDAVEQFESEPQAEYPEEEGGLAEPTEAEETIEVASQEGYVEEDAGELPVEDEGIIEEAEAEPEPEPEPEAEPEPEVAAPSPAPAPASKGRWDDLDSIISTSKPDEKKAPSKWGELGNIQTPKASPKDPVTPSTSSKWSDLDTIGTAKPSATPEAPAAKAASKWGDLDAIAGKSSTPSAGSKWGDLDALGSKSSAETTAPSATPSANKWGDLDNIGTKSGDIEPTPSSGNKWDDLDAIGSGGVKNLTPEQPPGGGASGKKWGDLDAIGGPKEPASDAGKWGNLDALGSKTGAPKSQTKSFIKPKAQDPAAAAAASAAAAKAKWGDLAADPANMDAEPSSAPGGKWGNLDAIGGGIAKSQPLDTPATAGGGAENKWGNLNSIPTPRSAQDPGGNWGDLSAIPTPSAPEPPTLIEGALPTSQVSNDASQKWKAGMSSDISTGARQVGEMRDKLKEKGKTVKVKVGWEKVSILVAAAIVASAGFLSYSFFTYPTPPAEKTMK